MRPAEEVWQRKSDEEILEASARLEEYTDQGREIILAEAANRGLDVSPLVEAGSRLRKALPEATSTNRCAYCDTRVLFRGIQQGALKFCNADCQSQAVLLSASHQLPDETVREVVHAVHR